MRQRVRLAVPLAACFVLSCTSSTPPTTPDTSASASPSTAPRPSDSPVPPTPARTLSGTVFAPEKLGAHPETFISNNGGTFITNNGGTFITNNGGTFLTNNGGTFLSNNGGTYRVTQAAPLGELPVANVEVALAEPVEGKLKTLEGRASVRADASGRYVFQDVPEGKTLVVVALLQGTDGKLATLQTLGTANRPSDVRAATTVATAAVVGNQTQALGAVDFAKYDTAVAAIAKSLTPTNLPDFGDGTKVRATAETILKNDADARAALVEVQASAGVGPASTPKPGSGGVSSEGNHGVAGPAAPATLFVQPTATSVYVKWTAVAGATGYRVYVDGVSTDTAATSFEATGPSFTPASAHTIEVSSLNGAAEGSKTPVSSQTLLAPGTGMWRFEAATDVRGCPIVVSNTEVVIGNAGTAQLSGPFALDAFGTAKWSAGVTPRFGTSLVRHAASGAFFAPGDDGTVHKFDAVGNPVTGAWPYNPGGAGQVRTPAEASDGTLILTSTSGNLVSLDRGTASPAFGPALTGMTGEPVVDGEGNLIAGSNSGVVEARTAASAAYWTSPTFGPISQGPAIDSDGEIVVVSDDENVYKLNPADGSVVWQFDLGSIPSCAPVVYDDQTILVGTQDGNLHRIRQDGTAEPGWPKPLGAGAVTGTPVVGADGTIYVGAFGHPSGTGGLGRVFALNASGLLMWASPYDTPQPVSGPLALNGRGVLFVPAGKLHAVATRSLGLSTTSPWPKYRKTADNTGKMPNNP